MYSVFLGGMTRLKSPTATTWGGFLVDHERTNIAVNMWVILVKLITHILAPLCVKGLGVPAL
jgi:hypothetical protein